MIKEFVDFSCAGSDHRLFKMPAERLSDLNLELSNLEIECCNNHKDYTDPGTPESPGAGLHAGKLLKRLLELARNEHEEVALMYAFSTFIKRVHARIEEVLYLEKLHPQSKIKTL
jgi:hypothetical protein